MVKKTRIKRKNTIKRTLSFIMAALLILTAFLAIILKEIY